MKNIIQNIKSYIQKDNVIISIAVTAFSTLLLIVALLGIQFKEENIEPLCFISLIIEFVYGVFISLKLIRNKNENLHLLPFLILNWFIGCFCANVFINVFENLPLWVYVLTFIFCLSNFLIYSHLKIKYYTPMAYLINGVSFLLIVYFAIYLAPIGLISVIGLIALGLGFYGLVPVIVVVIHVFSLINHLKAERVYLKYWGLGLGLVIFGFTLFAFRMNTESVKINSNCITKTFDYDDDLPAYIKVSQSLEPNFFNEILLKKKIVYIGTDNFFEFRDFGDFGSKQFNDRKIHDPIINTAYVFTKPLNLSNDDKISILKSNFDKRLETEEHLWSGNDLLTKNIKEDVKIFASNRLAYTEITIDVASDKNRWRQEAIYSFQLPEGAVANSLSLWVNGMERKGVLTTKEKAESAYKQIVGVEARDPSLMQWREGNRVVVRVFPISADLPRTFKCGFTTPLKLENSQLKYESIGITGPSISNAETVSRIQTNESEKFESNKDFNLRNGFYINESKGLDKWHAIVKMNASTFNTRFIWKDKVYTINEIEKQTMSFTPSEILLDLNSSWTTEELDEILSNNKQKYFVSLNNQKMEINKANSESMFLAFKNLQYSLPALYNMADSSLIITKCGTISPTFDEIKDSKYLQKIKERTPNKNLKVINLSQEINPFWQTIKEQNYVSYLNTDISKCIKLINTHQFIKSLSKYNTVNIEMANMAIQEVEKTSDTTFNGSNHIFRLYAFNKVLEEQIKIQNDSLANNNYVHLAKEANIVTPISSLIVLETDADYEKNGIEKNINTLGNASVNNHGAVPEPHEWAMIILGLIALIYFYKRRTQACV